MHHSDAEAGGASSFSKKKYPDKHILQPPHPWQRSKMRQHLVLQLLLEVLTMSRQTNCGWVSYLLPVTYHGPVSSLLHQVQICSQS
jgi:hypothetical protein